MPSTSPSDTSRPVSPSRTTSGIPAWRVATTGKPLSCASITATGFPSLSPSAPRWNAARIPPHLTHPLGDGLLRLHSQQFDLFLELPPPDGPLQIGAEGTVPDDLQAHRIAMGTGGEFRIRANASRVCSGPFLATNRPTARNRGGACAGSAPWNRLGSAPDGLISIVAGSAPSLLQHRLHRATFDDDPGRELEQALIAAAQPLELGF